jgi:hypothetical protein
VFRDHEYLGTRRRERTGESIDKSLTTVETALAVSFTMSF